MNAEFEFDENNFAIILKDNTGEVTDEGVNEGVSEGVNEGVNVLLDVITSDPGKRVPYYAEKIGTSVKNIERWLKNLKDNNSIEFKGAPKTGGYWLVKK